MVSELSGHSDDAEDFVFVDDRIGVSASREFTRSLVWDFTPRHDRAPDCGSR